MSRECRDPDRSERKRIACGADDCGRDHRLRDGRTGGNAGGHRIRRQWSSAGAWGDAFFIYDPESRIPPERQFPYATIVNHDYPSFDESSDLNREGEFRVNMWVSPGTFKRETPESDAEGIDYGALDEVIPHPVYGKQSWLSVLSPSPATSEKVKTLLAEAHDRARTRYDKTAR